MFPQECLKFFKIQKKINSWLLVLFGLKGVCLTTSNILNILDKYTQWRQISCRLMLNLHKNPNIQQGFIYLHPLTSVQYLQTSWPTLVGTNALRSFHPVSRLRVLKYRAGNEPSRSSSRGLHDCEILADLRFQL